MVTGYLLGQHEYEEAGTDIHLPWYHASDLLMLLTHFPPQSVVGTSPWHFLAISLAPFSSPIKIAHNF